MIASPYDRRSAARRFADWQAARWQEKRIEAARPVAPARAPLPPIAAPLDCVAELETVSGGAQLGDWIRRFDAARLESI